MWSRRRMGAAVAAAALVVGVSACGDDDGDALRADAGDDFETPVGSSPVFDGCGSTGSITNYAWVSVGAPDDMGGDVGKSLKDLAAECSKIQVEVRIHAKASHHARYPSRRASSRSWSSIRSSCCASKRRDREPSAGWLARSRGSARPAARTSGGGVAGDT